MTVYIGKNRTKDEIYVRSRLESNGMIGDAMWTVKQGDILMGHPFSWWNLLPNGRNEIEAVT